MDYSEVHKIKIYPLWFIITKISAFKIFSESDSAKIIVGTLSYSPKTVLTTYYV